VLEPSTTSTVKDGCTRRQRASTSHRPTTLPRRQRIRWRLCCCSAIADAALTEELLSHRCAQEWEEATPQAEKPVGRRHHDGISIAHSDTRFMDSVHGGSPFLFAFPESGLPSGLGETRMAFSISFNFSFVNCLRPRSSTGELFGQMGRRKHYGTNNGVGHGSSALAGVLLSEGTKCSHVNGVAFNDETNKS